MLINPIKDDACDSSVTCIVEEFPHLSISRSPRHVRSADDNIRAVTLPAATWRRRKLVGGNALNFRPRVFPSTCRVGALTTTHSAMTFPVPFRRGACGPRSRLAPLRATYNATHVSLLCVPVMDSEDRPRPPRARVIARLPA